MKSLPSDAQLVGSYELTGSYRKTGQVYGLPAHEVYRRLLALDKVEPNASLDRELARPAPMATLPPELLWKGLSLEEWFRLFEAARTLTIRQFCRAHRVPVDAFRRRMDQAFPEQYRAIVAARFSKAGRYVRGRKVENAVRDDLLSRGYPFSYRSPLSRGPFDVLAIRLISLNPRVLMVQVKAGMQITQDEATRLWDAATPCGAIPVLAGNPDGTGLQYRRLVAREERKLVPFDP